MNARFTQVVAGRVFASAASMVSGLVLLKLLPRHLGQDQFGVVNIAIQVLTYLPLLDGGFRLVLNREMLASGTGSRDAFLRFGQSLANRLTLAALAAGPLLCLALALTPAARKTAVPPAFFPALGAAGALTFASSMQVLTLVGLDRQGAMSLVQGGGSVLNIAGIWLALRAGLGVWAFPIGQGAAAAGMWAASALLVRAAAPATPILAWRWTDDCRRLWKTHAASAWGVFRMQLFIVLLLSLDLVVAGLVTADASILGAYGLVARVLGIGRGLLTSLGEASWPRIARGDTDPRELTRRVLALNAWLYGLLAGLLAGALPAVLAWYVDPGWTADPALQALVIARFLVVGLTSPASYALIGAGDFATMARCVGREIVAGTILAVPAGRLFGANGVAAAFLASTAAGTFFPILAAAARRHQLRPAALLGAIWLRGLAAAAVAGSLSAVLVAHGWTGIASLAASTAGGLAALAVALAVAWLRGRRHPATSAVARLWAGL